MLLTHGNFNLGFSVSARLGPPGNPLIYYDPSVIGSIGLQVSDYDSLTTDQQAFFFSDPTTPNTWADFSTFYSAVSVQSWFNDGNVMGTVEKGVAVYDKATLQPTLDRGLKWFGLYLALEMLASLEMGSGLEMR